jgi:hypothetical protein
VLVLCCAVRAVLERHTERARQVESPSPPNRGESPARLTNRTRASELFSLSLTHQAHCTTAGKRLGARKSCVQAILQRVFVSLFPSYCPLLLVLYWLLEPTRGAYNIDSSCAWSDNGVCLVFARTQYPLPFLQRTLA